MASGFQQLFLWVCICVCCLSATDSGRPVVTSIVALSKLARFEQALLSFARGKATLLPTQFVNFVSSVEEDYDREYGYPLTFIDFPLNQYRLVRRFSHDWPMWRKHLRLMKRADRASHVSSRGGLEFLTFYEQQSKAFNKIDAIDPNFDLPVADLTMDRLYQMYRNQSGLLPSEGPLSCPPLSEVELLEFCATALNNSRTLRTGFYIYRAIHWMTLFVDRMKRYLPYSSTMYMVEYVYKHSDTYGRPDDHDPILAGGRGMERLARVTKLMETFSQHFKKHFDQLDEDMKIRVCSSFPDRSERGNYCFLFHTPRAPYAPFKYEILHRNPYVAAVHNFMPLAMTQTYISFAVKQESVISGVYAGYSPDDGKPIRHVDAATRLSESTALDSDHPLNAWLDLRIEHATLLLPHSQPMRYGINDGERIQIQHYGLSGHYDVHHDYFERDSHGADKGNRLATVLLYLSDVTSGGCTAFPQLNVSWPPRAGSALVWFNLDPLNGTRLRQTEHMACPVNVGKKWVINRWIRSHLKTGHSRPVVK